MGEVRQDNIADAEEKTMALSKERRAKLPIQKSEHVTHGGLSTATRIGLAALALSLTLGVSFGAYKITHPDNPPITEPIQPRLHSDNWKIIPKDEIKQYATPSPVQSVGKDVYPTVLPPVVKEHADNAGYVVSYVGDPNDSTGRSITARGRRIGLDQTSAEVYEPEFGNDGQYIKGVFKAWVPDPADPDQKNSIYALLENPLNGTSYLTRVSLKYSTNSADASSLALTNSLTYFVVDNLNWGYKDHIARAEAYNNSTNSTFKRNPYGYSMIESMSDENPHDPNSRGRILEEFPAVGNLIEQGLSLDSLAKPGDYIAMSILSNSGRKDRNGAALAYTFMVQRFGGFTAWEQEVGLTTAPSPANQK